MSNSSINGLGYPYGYGYAPPAAQGPRSPYSASLPTHPAPANLSQQDGMGGDSIGTGVAIAVLSLVSLAEAGGLGYYLGKRTKGGSDTVGSGKSGIGGTREIAPGNAVAQHRPASENPPPAASAGEARATQTDATGRTEPGPSGPLTPQEVRDRNEKNTRNIAMRLEMLERLKAALKSTENDRLQTAIADVEKLERTGGFVSLRDAKDASAVKSFFRAEIVRASNGKGEKIDKKMRSTAEKIVNNELRLWNKASDIDGANVNINDKRHNILSHMANIFPIKRSVLSKDTEAKIRAEEQNRDLIWDRINKFFPSA